MFFRPRGYYLGVFEKCAFFVITFHSRFIYRNVLFSMQIPFRVPYVALSESTIYQLASDD